MKSIKYYNFQKISFIGTYLIFTDKHTALSTFYVFLNKILLFILKKKEI